MFVQPLSHSQVRKVLHAKSNATVYGSRISA